MKNLFLLTVFLLGASRPAHAFDCVVEAAEGGKKVYVNQGGLFASDGRQIGRLADWAPASNAFINEEAHDVIAYVSSWQHPVIAYVFIKSKKMFIDDNTQVIQKGTKLESLGSGVPVGSATTENGEACTMKDALLGSVGLYVGPPSKH